MKHLYAADKNLEQQILTNKKDVSESYSILKHM